MHSLQKQFHDFILSRHLIDKGEKVLLAVSGGLDSMVMSHLFFDAEIDFDIAHCNFGLRGEESNADEAFVRKWAEDHKVSCFIESFELEGKSIQIEAREVRYDWFNALTEQYGHHKVAIAHHLNDSLETVLINLTRGTGISGVSGISVLNNKIIRPLLFAERKDLLTYASNQKIQWREDSSNQKINYDRNLIRHEVIPILEKVNPSLHKTFFSTVERLSYTEDLLKRQVENIKKEFLKSSDLSCELNLEWINEPEDVVILSEILNAFGVNYATCREIFEAKGRAGKVFPVNDWIVTMDRSKLFINPNKEQSIQELIIDEFGEYNFYESIFKIGEAAEEEVSFDSAGVVFFDADRFKLPLKIRQWEEGDKFQPMGMKGHKKVSDLLIDEKTPLSRKKNVLVLESGQKIAWVVGYRIDDHFKISEYTKKIIKVSKSLISNI
ncbi:tRNA lysidine(34) synthetase TilS [Ekhidna sp.]